VWNRFLALSLGLAALAPAHDLITTKLTWSKEVSRVVMKRCAGCHRPEGRAFSLLTYEEARPWAKAIQEEVLRRRMPPWNAVKGFGEFRDELALSGEEVHLLSDWVEGGAPEGDPNLLPPSGKALPDPEKLIGKRSSFRPGMRLAASIELRGIELGEMPEGLSFKLAAEEPGGILRPLIWIEGYSRNAVQTYILREALRLPAGTRIKAYPDTGVTLKLVTGPLLRR